MKWYRLAAEQGISHTQTNLGLMHSIGQGVPQDSTEAAKWYRLAADQGDSEAQYELGAMYEKGRGIPQNYTLAHMWFNLASSAGLETGSRNRDRIASKISPDQIAQAQRLAVEWRRK